jgi:hypothetical protein
MDEKPEHARKSSELEEVIGRLKRDLEPIDIVVADHWPEDLVATGISRKGERSKLVYLALMLDEGGDLIPGERKYFYDCEILHFGAERPNEVVEHRERVTYQELRDAIRRYLRMPNSPMNCSQA